MRPAPLALALLLVSPVPLVAPATAQTPATTGQAAAAARGKMIAVGFCADCHAVPPDPARPGADAPSFAAMAKRLPSDVDILAAVIAYPHRPMPNIGLHREDVQDLLAYIAALR